MTESVSAKLLFAPDDSLRVAQFIRNQSFIYKNDAILTSGLVFFSFIIAVVLMADDVGLLRIFGAMVFSAIPAIVAGIAVLGVHRFFNPWLMKRTITKYFASSPIANEETLMTFSDEGIFFESASVTSKSKWTAITKIKETKTDILFYSGLALTFFLPKRSIESVEILQKLRRLIREAVEERAHLLESGA